MSWVFLFDFCLDTNPGKKDPLQELAAACQKQGMKLGVYYSQSQDWHHPGGAASTIIIKSREGHGAPDFLKYDLATGEELAHHNGWSSQPMPEWAKPYADQ